MSTAEIRKVQDKRIKLVLEQFWISIAPPGFGLRQPSAAIGRRRYSKRQRAAAVQDAAAPKGYRRWFAPAVYLAGNSLSFGSMASAQIS
jgi:hypothetical protein